MKLLKKDNILKISAWVCFISLIFQIVNGLWPQISMFLFNGKVLFPNVFFKFTFLVGLFISFFIQKRIIKGRLLKVWISFACYLIFEFFYFLLYMKYDWKLILFGFNSYYFWLLCIPFVPSLSEVIKEKTIINIFIGLFIPISVIALLQHFTNSSILPVKSADGYFEVLVYNFYNNIRAFSLFGVNFGLAFFTCIISLLFSIFYINTKKKYYLLLLFFSVYIVYITYTRTGYLILTFSLLTFLIYRIYEKIIKILPLIYFFLSFILLSLLYSYGKHNVNKMIVAQYKNSIIETSKTIKNKINNQLISGDFMIYSPKIEELEFSKLNSHSKAPIAASDSFFMRIVNWETFPKSLLDTPLSIIFGTGIYYSKYFNDIKYFCIDNIYIDSLIHIGLLGFLIYFWLLYEIYLFICNSSNNSIILKVSLFVMSTITISGFFGGIIPVYLNFILVSFFVLNGYDEQNIY
ncbi:MAG: hypothetical protein GX445_04015 [Elusimicrobia bacterium]|nr:hypothetical protein [Elusimicrobiota bacterium]